MHGIYKSKYPLVNTSDAEFLVFKSLKDALSYNVAVNINALLVAWNIKNIYMYILIEKKPILFVESHNPSFR